MNKTDQVGDEELQALQKKITYVCSNVHFVTNIPLQGLAK